MRNIKDAPPPEKDDGFDVYRINNNGYTLSPFPESEGIIHNRYYYVDAEGHREKIDESCIHNGGTEGFGNGEYEYVSSYFFVTQTQCGDTFEEQEYPPDLPRGMSLDQIIEEEGLRTE